MNNSHLSLEERVSILEELLLEDDDKERTDVIVKVNGKWRVKGKKQKYWDAEYDTKEKAKAALRAYWANHH